jgi:hypothetical protein
LAVSGRLVQQLPGTILSISGQFAMPRKQTIRRRDGGLHPSSCAAASPAIALIVSKKVVNRILHAILSLVCATLHC